jgi:hypothetical protein
MANKYCNISVENAMQCCILYQIDIGCVQIAGFFTLFLWPENNKFKYKFLKLIFLMLHV